VKEVVVIRFALSAYVAVVGIFKLLKIEIIVRVMKEKICKILTMVIRIGKSMYSMGEGLLQFLGSLFW
jgi:hypothetical protein